MDENFRDFVFSRKKDKIITSLFSRYNDYAIETLLSDRKAKLRYSSEIAKLQKEYFKEKSGKPFDFERESHVNDSIFNDLALGYLPLCYTNEYKLQNRTYAYEGKYLEKLLHIRKQQIKIGYEDKHKKCPYLNSDTSESFYCNKKISTKIDHTIYTQWIKGTDDSGKKYLFKKVISFPEPKGPNAVAGKGISVALYAIPGGKDEFTTCILRYDSFCDFPHINKYTTDEVKVPTPHFHFLDCENALFYLNNGGGSGDATSISKMLEKMKDNPLLTKKLTDLQDLSNNNKDRLSEIINLLANVELKSSDGRKMTGQEILERLSSMSAARELGNLTQAEEETLNAREFILVNKMIDNVTGLEQSPASKEFYHQVMKHHFNIQDTGGGQQSEKSLTTDEFKKGPPTHGDNGPEM